MSIKETLLTLPQYALPHHFLSRVMSTFTHCENPAWKNFLIQQISQAYHVNMAEALEEDPTAYRSFNHFFTRQLKSGVRPIASEINSLACPADGVVSQAGVIDDETIFQAKGKSFTVTDLLGGDSQRAEPFRHGLFSTIYLSPRDYHRLHLPLAGRLKAMVHVPGRLFSVNAATTNTVPGLFARNERVVCLFDTEIGEMALVLVGAIFVSSIETVWHGVVTPPTQSQVRYWNYADKDIVLEKGAEIGRFNMGSTIIVLVGQEKAQWHADFVAGKTVKMGEAIGQFAPSKPL
jgi:phosphatidylserine decarboxylase